MEKDLLHMHERLINSNGLLHPCLTKFLCSLGNAFGPVSQGLAGSMSLLTDFMRNAQRRIF